MKPGIGGLATALMVACVNASPALAIDCKPYFENQRYTLVVPYGAGGGYDAYARAFAPVLAGVTGSDVVVSNVPAAGGRVGLDRVADAEPDDNLLLVIGTVRLFDANNGRSRFDDVVALASFNTDIWTWYGRAGDDIRNYVGKTMVSANSAEITALARFRLAGLATGIDMAVVSGYDGSVEANAAVLRGEADVAGRSLQAGEVAKEGGDHAFLLMLTDAPVEGYEDVPHIAGPGGIVAEMTAGMDPQIREERMKIAQLVAEMETHIRSVLVGSKTEGERRDCLRQAVETAMFSDDLAAALLALKRPLRPMDSKQATAHLSRTRSAYEAAAPYIAKLKP